MNRRNEDPPEKRGSGRERETTADGKKWGKPIEWEHEEKERREHADKDPVPVKRKDPEVPQRREALIPPSLRP